MIFVLYGNESSSNATISIIQIVPLEFFYIYCKIAKVDEDNDKNTSHILWAKTDDNGNGKLKQSFKWKM